MDYEYGIPEAKKRQRTQYNFHTVRPGASVHVKDHAERCRVMAAFRYYVQNTAKMREAKAYATSTEVGDEDHKGPGFRIWFRSGVLDAAATAGMMDYNIQMPEKAGGAADDI